MSVPIIGQPKIGDWSLSFVLECTCETRHLFTGKPASATKPGTILTCKCGKAYMVMGMPQQDPLTGDLVVNLAMREPSIGDPKP